MDAADSSTSMFFLPKPKREREKIETEKNYNKETVKREKKKHSKLNEK